VIDDWASLSGDSGGDGCESSSADASEMKRAALRLLEVFKMLLSSACTTYSLPTRITEYFFMQFPQLSKPDGIHQSVMKRGVKKITTILVVYHALTGSNGKRRFAMAARAIAKPRIEPHQKRSVIPTWLAWNPSRT
jgi:hypothetical protein